MNESVLTYSSLVVTCGVLALLLTGYWLQDRTTVHGDWVVACWLMLVSVLLTTLRDSLPSLIGIIIPSLLVTCSLLVILRGISRLMARQFRHAPAFSILILHAVLLIWLTLTHGSAGMRMMANSAVWAGTSIFAVAATGIGVPPAIRRSFIIPMVILSLHAVFHCVRLVIVASGDPALATGNLGTTLVVGSVVETNLFIITLYIAVSMSGLQRANTDLREAQANIRTLHGVIPICSYCHKIRNDQKSWEGLENYIMEHSEAKFSHGLCPDCVRQHYPEYAKLMKLPPATSQAPENQPAAGV